jgi:hypothetical protein
MWPDQRKDKSISVESISVEAPFPTNDFKRRSLSKFASRARPDGVAGRATKLRQPLASFDVTAERSRGSDSQSETARRSLAKIIHTPLHEIRACSNYLSPQTVSFTAAARDPTIRRSPYAQPSQDPTLIESIQNGRKLTY